MPKTGNELIYEIQLNASGVYVGSLTNLLKFFLTKYHDKIYYSIITITVYNYILLNLSSSV